MRLKESKLLADENISPKVVAYLRELGADVLDIKECGWQGKTDYEIIDRALAEKRICLTCDKDFGSLTVYGQKPHYGIIFIRPGDLKPKNIIKLLRELNDKVDFKNGMIAILSDTGIRIRYKRT
ncbi:MAG: DUF5615 family PIN-like protein [bacterium]